MQKCRLIREKEMGHFSSSWGTPMRSRLAKCCFCNERKIEKEFEKKKWHVKIHAKMPFYQKEREVTFFLLWGTPMRSRLAKCCFCNGSKIETDFEKRNGT